MIEAQMGATTFLGLPEWAIRLEKVTAQEFFYLVTYNYLKFEKYTIIIIMTE